MANYIAIIHKEHDSEYGVSFPDFSGCITAGKTIDEAKDLAQEALQFHVDGMIEDKQTLPAASSLEDVQDETAVAYFVVSVNLPKKEPVRINCSFDPTLLNAMDARASELGMTRSGFIADAVRKQLHT